MRLLKRLLDGEFQLVSVSSDDPPPYAILSHTWADGQEVTFSELVAGEGKDKTGYAKIRFCSEQAAADALEYCWVDTCCIDKSTCDELSTAINSMFLWYKRASKCYVYLSDVCVPDEISDAEAFPVAWQEAFRRSRWFTRGWTLQELLAPANVEFFCQQGKRLGDRVSLEQEIHNITQLPIAALRGQPFSEFSVEDRMSWAARRTTTLKEDRIYCLLGIFGVFLPLIYGEGEAYAALRLEEEIQKRQQDSKTGSSRDLSVLSLLPFPRNELFVGRTDELRTLEQYLLSPNRHRRATVYGLGGCGKSALAIEFAYRILSTHARQVFWVPAISQESFEFAYREIGVRLRIPGISNDTADVKKLVQEALSAAGADNWLMIVDNADDCEVLLSTRNSGSEPTQLSDYLPRSDRGAILFTTRSRKLAGALTPSSVFRLDDMSKDETRQLLKQRTREQVSCDDETAVDELLESLAYLPLAIVQAAAFMSANDVSVSSYQALFQDADAQAELFNEDFADPSRYEELDGTIAKTWHISFDQMRKQDPLATEYLSFMACIDRVNIPQSLLPLGVSVVQQTKALGTLTGYAFITERLQMAQGSDGIRFFDMHRLVHMASVWWLEKHNERTVWARTAVERLETLVPYGGHDKKESWMTYLQHAICAADIDRTTSSASKASLLSRVGQCQASLGQYSLAERTHRQALSMKSKVLGLEHLDTLMSVDHLAVVLDSQGNYKEAEAINRETLALRRKVLGHEHLRTLTSINNLASVLDSQGKYEEAELMYRKTLAVCTKTLGFDHCDTLISMNNLAAVLDSQGNYEEAIATHREVLALRRKVLGPEHPDTLTSMNNLAGVLNNQGKYAEAEALHRKELAICTRALGPEHPDTLTSMSNLASVLNRQGKDKEAEVINREVLALRKKVLGPKHPGTLTTMNNLARVLDSQGRYDEAEAINRETLALRQEVLGPEHPGTLTTMNNLARVLDSQGRYDEAEATNRETLALRREILGPRHPDTLMSSYQLALVLTNQLRYDDSHHLYEQACAAYDATLGRDHPTTRACRQHYNQLLAAQESNRVSDPSERPQRSAGARLSKRSKVVRGLAKIGVKTSKLHAD